MIRSNDHEQSRQRKNSGDDADVPQTVMIDDFDFFYEEEKQKMMQPQFKIEEPSKLMIEEMLQDSRYFLVRGRKYEFLGNRDPIFSLTQAAPRKPPNASNTCPLCDVSLPA